MVKVFLVEDEIVIRSAIKNSINWEKEGYEFVGEASDGELAYPIVLKQKPDVLITDIKMPFMDGLELSRLVKEALPDIKILILSGYDEFDYAKEAIRLGVAEYLLKPVSSVKLLEALGKIKKIVEQERRERELKEQYKKDNQEHVENEKIKLFTDIVSGNLSMSETLGTAGELGMNLGAQMYTVMLFKASLRIDDYDTPEQAMKLFARIEAIQDITGGIYCFRKGVEGWAFLIMSESKEEIENQINWLRQYLISMMNDYPEIEYFGGIGRAVSRIRELGKSYDEAGSIFASRFVHDSRQIFTWEDMNLSEEKEAIYIQDFDLIERNRTMMGKFLAKGTMEEIESFVTAYLEKIPKENLQSSLMRQYLTMDMYVVARSFCSRLGIPEEECNSISEEMEETLRVMTTAESVSKYVRNLLKQIIRRRDTVSKSRYSDVIEAAKIYIAEHYMLDDVSLNTAAAAVNMSPSYFSSVFGREAGRTFVEYLTDVRMDKAKELLMCSALKTSEIGYEVGYKDPHYFSYIFKKTQNCSPKDYRQRGRK